MKQDRSSQQTFDVAPLNQRREGSVLRSHAYEMARDEFESGAGGLVAGSRCPTPERGSRDRLRADDCQR